MGLIGLLIGILAVVAFGLAIWALITGNWILAIILFVVGIVLLYLVGRFRTRAGPPVV